jgi:hypothetical protein
MGKRVIKVLVTGVEKIKNSLCGGSKITSSICKSNKDILLALSPVEMRA